MPRMPRRSARTQALRQRGRNERNRVERNFNNYSGNFETMLLETNLSICISCCEELDSTLIHGDRCSRCRRAAFNLHPAENKMDFGPIPPELFNLSLIEQMLIPRVHPVISLFKIHGQQTGYSGHVIGFFFHSPASSMIEIVSLIHDYAMIFLGSIKILVLLNLFYTVIRSYYSQTFYDRHLLE